MSFTSFDTSFGRCGISWEGDEVTAFCLPSVHPTPTAASSVSNSDSPQVPEIDCAAAPDWVQAIVRSVRSHLAGHTEDFSRVTLAWHRVSSFQRAVYQQTLAIPPGFKRSYGDLAKAMALGPEASRAVGVALSTNPWPLLVPCHRVVSASDKMTGFSGPGGIRTKTRLLVLEGAELLSE